MSMSLRTRSASFRFRISNTPAALQMPGQKLLVLAVCLRESVSTPLRCRDPSQIRDSDLRLSRRAGRLLVAESRAPLGPEAALRLLRGERYGTREAVELLLMAALWPGGGLAPRSTAASRLRQFQPCVSTSST